VTKPETTTKDRALADAIEYAADVRKRGTQYGHGDVRSMMLSLDDERLALRARCERLEAALRCVQQDRNQKVFLSKETWEVVEAALAGEGK